MSKSSLASEIGTFELALITDDDGTYKSCLKSIEKGTRKELAKSLCDINEIKQLLIDLNILVKRSYTDDIDIKLGKIPNLFKLNDTSYQLEKLKVLFLTLIENGLVDEVLIKSMRSIVENNYGKVYHEYKCFLLVSFILLNWIRSSTLCKENMEQLKKMFNDELNKTSEDELLKKVSPEFGYLKSYLNSDKKHIRSKAFNICNQLRIELSVAKLTELSERNLGTNELNNLIMIIGPTGVGKTTLLNRLNGAKYEFNNITKKLKFMRGQQINLEIDINESGAKSDTIFPNIITFNRSNDVKLNICDSAGFFDNRQGLLGLCSSLSIPIILKNANHIRAVCLLFEFNSVFTTNEMRGINFRRTCRSFGQLIKNFNENENKNILFAFTKTLESEETLVKQLKASLEEHREFIRKEEKDDFISRKENEIRINESQIDELKQKLIKIEEFEEKKRKYTENLNEFEKLGIEFIAVQVDKDKRLAEQEDFKMFIRNLTFENGKYLIKKRIESIENNPNLKQMLDHTKKFLADNSEFFDEGEKISENSISSFLLQSNQESIMNEIESFEKKITDIHIQIQEIISTKLIIDLMLDDLKKRSSLYDDLNKLNKKKSKKSNDQNQNMAEFKKKNNLTDQEMERLDLKNQNQTVKFLMKKYRRVFFFRNTFINKNKDDLTSEDDEEDDNEDDEDDEEKDKQLEDEECEDFKTYLEDLCQNDFQINKNSFSLNLSDETFTPVKEYIKENTQSVLTTVNRLTEVNFEIDKIIDYKLYNMMRFKKFNIELFGELLYKDRKQVKRQDLFDFYENIYENEYFYEHLKKILENLLNKKVNNQKKIANIKEQIIEYQSKFYPNLGYGIFKRWFGHEIRIRLEKYFNKKRFHIPLERVELSCITEANAYTPIYFKTLFKQNICLECDDFLKHTKVDDYLKLVYLDENIGEVIFNEGAKTSNGDLFSKNGQFKLVKANLSNGELAINFTSKNKTVAYGYRLFVKMENLPEHKLEIDKLEMDNAGLEREIKKIQSDMILTRSTINKQKEVLDKLKNEKLSDDERKNQLLSLSQELTYEDLIGFYPELKYYENKSNLAHIFDSIYLNDENFKKVFTERSVSKSEFTKEEVAFHLYGEEEYKRIVETNSNKRVDVNSLLKIPWEELKFMLAFTKMTGFPCTVLVQVMDNLKSEEKKYNHEMKKLFESRNQKLIEYKSLQNELKKDNKLSTLKRIIPLVKKGRTGPSEDSAGYFRIDEFIRKVDSLKSLKEINEINYKDELSSIKTELLESFDEKSKETKFLKLKKDDSYTHNLDLNFQLVNQYTFEGDNRDSIKMFAKNFSNYTDKKIEFYLPQLIETARKVCLFFESDDETRKTIENLLLDKSNTLSVAVKFYWFLKAELEYKESRAKYVTGLESDIEYLRSLLAKLEKESKHARSFKIQENFMKICDQIKKSDPNLKIVNEIDYMFDSRVKIDQIDKESLKVFKSKNAPVLMNLKSSKNNSSHTIIYKSNDDLRRDYLIQQSIYLIDEILKGSDKKIDLCFSPYNVLPAGLNKGFIEPVQDCITIAEIYSNSSNILDYMKHKYKFDEEAESNFQCVYAKSLAGFILVNYLFGIGDRHYHNIMLTKSGRIFHIDLTFLFGEDPKNILFFKAPRIILNEFLCSPLKNITEKDIMKDVCNAFSVLYDNQNTLLNFFEIISGSYISSEEYGKLNDTFVGSKEEALSRLENVLDCNYESYYGKILNIYHNIVHCFD